MHRRTRDQRTEESVVLPLEFERERSGLRARRLIVLVLGFICLSLGLLGVAPFHSVVIAPGALAPKGEAVVAHHDRGGLIDQLFIARGDRVAAGQPLMKLRADAVLSEIDELKATEFDIKLRIERLRALIESRPPDFSEFGAAPGAVEAAKALYLAERAAQEAEISALEAQRDTRLRTAQALQTQAELLAVAAESLAERRQMAEDLLARDAGSRRELLDAATRLAEIEAQRAATLGSIIEAEREAEEFARRIDSARADRRATWLTGLSDALAALATTTEQIKRRQLSVEQRTVRAPVAGQVLSLGGGGPGDVIDPGGMVAEIVPGDRALVARIRIPPERIGAIAPGDDVRVYVTSFDDTEIGELDGSVALISPSVVSGPKDEQYYAADVKLDAAASIDGRLKPGMSLTANILGSERTVLGYLLRPFEKGLDAAFREGG